MSNETDKAPDFLTEEARAEWFRVTEEFRARGIFHQLKIASLEAYCVAYGRWIRAERAITEQGEVITPKGSGAERVNTYLGIADKAMRRMRDFASDLEMVEQPPIPSDLEGIPDRGSNTPKKGTASSWFMQSPKHEH